jgi:hypothetical protein
MFTLLFPLVFIVVVVATPTTHYALTLFHSHTCAACAPVLDEWTSLSKQRFALMLRNCSINDCGSVVRALPAVSLRFMDEEAGTVGRERDYYLLSTLSDVAICAGVSWSNW